VSITSRRFLPLLRCKALEGQIFGPMARTYAYALLALIATSTWTPVMSAVLLHDAVRRVETFLVRQHPQGLICSCWRSRADDMGAAGIALEFLAGDVLLGTAPRSEFCRKLEEGQSWHRALLPPTITARIGQGFGSAPHAQLIRSYPPVGAHRLRAGPRETATDPAGAVVAEFFDRSGRSGWRNGRDQGGRDGFATDDWNEHSSRHGIRVTESIHSSTSPRFDNQNNIERIGVWG